MNNSLMIELYVTQNNKKIEHWKDDSVYLLNDAKHIFQERPLENFVNDDTKMDANLRFLININMKNLSVNVKNCALSIKQCLVGTLHPFQKKNMIISGMKIERLLMPLKFQTTTRQ